MLRIWSCSRERRKHFFGNSLKLEKGLPSHDTFSRVLRLLDPEQFSACFQRFTSKFSQACQGVVAIDGKVLRRSFDKASGKSPLHIVSAWGCEQRLVLAQIATDAKSNEITAVPQLLKLSGIGAKRIGLNGSFLRRISTRFPASSATMQSVANRGPCIWWPAAIFTPRCKR